MLVAQGVVQHLGATVIQLSPLPFVVQIQCQAKAPPQRGWLVIEKGVFLASYLLRLLS